MKVKDREAWRRFRAGQAKKRYEDGILSFAERWAGRMESRLTARVRVADVAGDTINDPTVRLTSLQIASAVAALIKFWVHGEELKRWYALVVEARKEARAAEAAKEGVCT
ncbi:hypothetical protein KKD80_02685 [Patescibacteria group bacterium]|nr:hypothetical protein [Patescibacteria group bacterium]